MHLEFLLIKSVFYIMPTPTSSVLKRSFFQNQKFNPALLIYFIKTQEFLSKSLKKFISEKVFDALLRKLNSSLIEKVKSISKCRF